ncbi:MAG: MoaD family protein [Caldiserica bacterium]|jgi:MoaD family protein|nr:MoaD family protein [Caldisericota bacterium]
MLIIIKGETMAKAKLKMYGLFREKCEVEEIELSGRNFLEILESLVQRFPSLKDLIFDENMKLKENVYLINGRNINLLDGINTTIKEGDNIAIFPIITGG